MGYMAVWKMLEDMIVQLRRKGTTVPPNVLDDLKSAKLMINIAEKEGSQGTAHQKVEEYLGSVEASLVAEVEKAFGSEHVDTWLRRLEEARIQPDGEATAEDKFVSGVPRDQKWIRVEPIQTLPPERLRQLAQEQNLQIKKENDGRLTVYGKPENIKEFIKKMTAEAAK